MSFFSKLFGGSRDTDTHSGNLTVLSAEEFKSQIAKQKPLRLIDVRTRMEFQSGHIKGAKNIDIMNAAAFEQAVSSMDKEAPVYLYCRSGQRSRNAGKKLQKLGFTEIYDLRGGYMAWS